MEGHIKEMSAYAAGILKEYTVGKVHSVYGKTINLSVGEELLALQASGSPLSPLSLITDMQEKAFKTLGIENSDPVFISDSWIQVGKMRFFMENAALAELCPDRPLPQKRLGALADSLAELVCREQNSILGRAMYQEQETELLVSAARNHLVCAEKEAGRGNWEEAAKELCSLVGLGIGLTPGGDDFLCGVLAGIELGNGKEHPFSGVLHAEIGQSLYRTNEISRAFLKCALKGQYGRIAQMFYKNGAEEIFTEAKRIGHSSGVDTLCGVLYFWKLQKIFAVEAEREALER